jgi:hypothetical protein
LKELFLGVLWRINVCFWCQNIAKVFALIAC